MNFPVFNPNPQFDPNDIPRSIDSLMNAYMGMQAMNADRVAKTLQLGVDPYSVTPEQLQQAQRPAPAQSPESAATSAPLEDNNVSTLRNLMQMRQQGAQLGAQQAQAGLQKTQADVEKASGEAALLRRRLELLGGNGAELDFYTNQIKSGKMTLDDLSSLGRSEEANDLRLAINNRLASAGVDVAGLGRTADAKKSGMQDLARVQYGDAQKLGTAAGTLEDVLSKAEPMIARLGPKSLRVLNDAWAKGLRSVNDADAQSVLTFMTEAKGLYASVLSNGAAASESDKKDAHETIGEGLNTESYAAMKNAITFTAERKVKRLKGAGFHEPAPEGEAGKKSYDANPAAQKIRDDFKAGKITRDQAKAMLARI